MRTFTVFHLIPLFSVILYILYHKKSIVNINWIYKLISLDNNLNATEVEHYNDRDYADCILNYHFYDWTYTEPTQLQWKSIAAHEIGHALGLLHTNADGDVEKLMYQGFNVRTATSATRDEVLGINALYS